MSTADERNRRGFKGGSVRNAEWTSKVVFYGFYLQGGRKKSWHGVRFTRRGLMLSPPLMAHGGVTHWIWRTEQQVP
jgi:hypothetical protein